tara:strand:+ start:1684 stop:3087 length:1404 start_codon:yes stop_codon:yes gene_type:complete
MADEETNDVDASAADEQAQESQGESSDKRGVPDFSGGPKQDMKIKAKAPKPKSVNKKLVYGGASMAVILALAVIYASTQKQRSIRANMQGEEKAVNISDKATLPATGAGLPSGYEEMRAYNRQKELKEAARHKPRTGIPAQSNVELPVSLQEAVPSNKATPQQGPSYDQNDPRLMAARQAAIGRLSAQKAAMAGSSNIKPKGTIGSLNAAKNNQAGTMPTIPNFNIPDMPQMAFAPNETLQANNQDAKQGYLDQDRESDVYLNQPLIKPASPYQVMAGNIVPSSLITGLNSDLPGKLTAQVRHNVYDSVTGRYLLIPQGTRILGEYSSSVTYGQNRALVVWNRLIFPNGKSIVLDGMPGVDLSGFAGFKDKVNYHFMRMMGAAVLGSVVATAADAAEDDGDTISDNALGGTAQTADQTIQEIIQKQLNVQPTIEIRPGYKFNIVVLADMILEPYDPHPATTKVVARR